MLLTTSINEEKIVIGSYEIRLCKECDLHLSGPFSNTLFVAMEISLPVEMPTEYRNEWRVPTNRKSGRPTHGLTYSKELDHPENHTGNLKAHLFIV